MWYGRAGSLRVFYEVLLCHFGLLFGVVSVRMQHDNGVCEGKQLVSVIIVLFVRLVEGQSELPDDPFDLLGLPRKPKPTKQQSDGLIKLYFIKLEQHAVGMQDFKHLLIILSKIVPQHGLVQPLALDQIGCDILGRIRSNSALLDLFSDGVLWVAVKEQDHPLIFLVETLDSFDESVLIQQRPINLVFLIVAHPGSLLSHSHLFAILQILVDLFSHFHLTLLSLVADH